MLTFKQISFCGKIAHNLVDDNQKEYFLNKLYNNYQISITDKDYIVLKEKHINQILKHRYYLSTVSNGNRYFLFLCIYEGRKLNLFIDHKVKKGYKYPRILNVDYDFDIELYKKNTLMSGELVKKVNDSWLFILSNLIIYDGCKLNMNIIGKMNIIYRILTNDYKYSIKQPCELKVKKIFKMNDINTIQNDFIKHIDYSIKGLSLYADNPTFHNYIFIYKQEEINIDTIIKKIEEKLSTIEHLIEHVFNLKKTKIPDIYELYTLYNSKEYKYGFAHIPSLKMSKYIKELFYKKETDELPINCIFSPQFKKWEPNMNNNEYEKIDDLKHLMNNIH